MSNPALSDDTLDALMAEAMHGDGGLPDARGRKAKDIVLEFSRNLNEADIAEAMAGTSVAHIQPPLKQLRQQHHALARLLSDGIPVVEAALITGYSPGRITMLKGDPAFQELMAHYTTAKREVYIDVHQRMADLGLAAADELRDRLEDKPASFSNRELKDIMVDAVDRSGTVDSISSRAGAKGVSVVVNFVKSPHAGAPKPTRPGEVIETVDFEMIPDVE